MRLASAFRAGALLLAAAGVGLALVLLPLGSYVQGLLEWVRGMGPWGPVLLGVAYVLAAVLLVPGSLLTLGAGFLFGVVVGTVTVSLASTLGASAAFLLGRTLARPWVERRVRTSPRFRALEEAIRQQGFTIVLLVRLSPIFPFTLLNYALGLTPVSFRAFVLASWIGMLPATVVYVYVGSTLHDLADVAGGRPSSSPATKILFWGGLVVAVGVTIFLTRLARRALGRALPSEGQAGPPHAQRECHA